MRRALRNRLAFRLGTALFVATAAILLAASVWNLRLQRSHLTRLVVTSAAERADDIRRATREAMLHDRPGEVGRIIDTLASEPPIERIRLFDKRGRVRSSSEPGEMGTLVDTVAEQCVSCHRPGETLTRLAGEERARIFAAADGSRVLAVIAPIRNETACTEAACHSYPASQSILGVLDVQLPLRGVDRSLAESERQMLLGLLATAAAVLGLAWLLIWRLVLRPEAERRGVDLRLEATAGALRLVCDAAQLEQMAMALALNAIEASPAGGEVSVCAEHRADGGGVVLTVRDGGRGIPREDLDRIFEPFFTTKSGGAGLGLGLAVVYGIVERHHGTIEVDSRVGGGTRVTLRLPRRPPSPERTEEPREVALA